MRFYDLNRVLKLLTWLDEHPGEHPPESIIQPAREACDRERRILERRSDTQHDNLEKFYHGGW